MYKNRYLLIPITIILTAIVSVSTHVLITQYFHAPALKIPSMLNLIVGLVIKFGMVIAPMFIYIYSRHYWENIKLAYRIILFAVLLMALTEQLFRDLFMNIIVGNPWQYELLSKFPTYLGYVVISFCICLFLKNVIDAKHFKFLLSLLFAVMVTALLIFVRNLAYNVIAPLLSHVSQPELNGIRPPYDMRILIPAYITFIEPTIAAFIVFHLIQKKLQTLNTFSKGLVMAGIIVTIHAGIYSVVQIVSSQGNIFYRIFYYGQFLWEYLALGLFTAYSYALFRDPALPSNSDNG